MLELAESSKILEEFRCDLRMSVDRLEDMLRKKVDRINLDEFGRKIDNRLVSEVSKKLDKFDLKKNNNIMNKKVIKFSQRLIIWKIKLVRQLQIL